MDVIEHEAAPVLFRALYRARCDYFAAISFADAQFPDFEKWSAALELPSNMAARPWEREHARAVISIETAETLPCLRLEADESSEIESLFAAAGGRYCDIRGLRPLQPCEHLGARLSPLALRVAAAVNTSGERFCAALSSDMSVVGRLSVCTGPPRGVTSFLYLICS